MTSRLPGMNDVTRRRRRAWRFSEINGEHPWRAAAPGGFVDYHARIRHGGRAFYLNFDLAKEMGLIPVDTPHELDAQLSAALVETFSLVIINEYDLEHGLKVDPRDVRPQPYMATRYLQLQHPSKKGLTSGDGRSIWNGSFRGKGGVVWDITSCGTGATRLSPACAIEQRFFRTGDKRVSYGCGRAQLEDGIAAAVMSEIFHHSGVPTERTLAIIAFDDGTSINVRAGKNLFRPAHLFSYIKQGDYAGLKSAVDYFIERQVRNGEWPPMKTSTARYRYMLERVACDFARATAMFESEYIFCWMDWDGDNILMDGGIIDYGSVRQFGLYHHEYRYDDVERMSTTITEQKNKARYIVQTFAQITDFLLTKQKKNIKQFAGHPALRLFDRVFDTAKDEAMLYRIGLPVGLCKALMTDSEAVAEARRLRELCDYFERAKSSRGSYEVTDGITWDAIFCLRDVLRELPAAYLRGQERLSAQEFMQTLRSHYATEEDARLTPNRRQRIAAFQDSYWRMLRIAAGASGRSPRRLLREMEQRSRVINRYDRITGDALIWIAKTLSRAAATMSSGERQQMIEDLIATQVLRPEFQSHRRRHAAAQARRRSDALYESILEIVREHREGL